MSDNMHHQWLLLAACFWVIFMFMVASKFITLTFKDPDGKFKFNVCWERGDGIVIHINALPVQNASQRITAPFQ